MGLIELLKKNKPGLQRWARVRKGTHIDMVEYDLFLFRRSEESSDWETMVKKWLNKDASLNLFFQLIHPESREVIKGLQETYKERLRLYEISNTQPRIIQGVYLKTCLEELREVHFTLFYNPNQMWIEGNHKVGENQMLNCQYFKEGFQDERTPRCKKIIRDLKQYAEQVRF